MSRVAKKTIELPKGVEFKQTEDTITVKGPKGLLTMAAPRGVSVLHSESKLDVAPKTPMDDAMAGTIRSLIANMVSGVHEGYTRKLELVGVGYRAAVAGKNLNLSLGFSHPVVIVAPDGITLETPSQTEVLVKGVDKQQVGELAAKIRAVRPPEPYKGKGVRYAGERIVMKEAKKA